LEFARKQKRKYEAVKWLKKKSMSANLNRRYLIAEVFDEERKARYGLLHEAPDLPSEEVVVTMGPLPK